MPVCRPLVAQGMQVPFAMNYAFARFEIDVASVELHQFTNSDARGRQQIDHRQITHFGAGIPKKLKSLIGIDRFQYLGGSDLRDSSYWTFVDIIFFLKPGETAGQNASDIVDCYFAYTSILRLPGQIVSDVIGCDLVNWLGDLRGEARESTRIIAQ